MSIDSINPIILIYLVIAVIALLIASQPKSGAQIAKTILNQKEKAMRPPLPAELKKKKPQEGDFILGKLGKHYSAWDINKDGHILILGGSGSGKSSCYILPLLMLNPDTAAYVIDIKGELHHKATRAEDSRICVFAPYDHTSYGFNPFYALSDSSTEQDILETMRTIAISLIPMGTSKDTFWPTSARNMLIGLMISYWNYGNHNLISIIDCILGSPAKEQIEMIINESAPDSNQYKYLVQFFGMADETLMSVYSNMSNSLSCFSDLDLRWAFSEATQKVSPLTLEEKKSIYISIPENKLAAYAAPLGMITNLTFMAMSKRPESSHKILFVLDELARIVSGAGMDGLIDALMTFRSRRVTCVLAFQTIESLDTGFSEGQITTLVGNCAIKIVLDASSSKTQKMVCEDWVPKYLEHQQSKNAGEKTSYNYSFQYSNRLHPADLMELIPHGEAVVVTPAGYTMLEKVPYYKDKTLKQISDEIKNTRKEGSK